jgi:hypothetical protein
MRVALPTLIALLQNSVVEIKFRRRRPKQGDSPFRRMLCTNSRKILESDQGRSLLHFESANSPSRKFDPSTKNLAVAWDIFMQDYRCINVNECDVVTVIPADNEFWEYYNTSLLPMSAEEKTSFMNS